MCEPKYKFESGSGSKWNVGFGARLNGDVSDPPHCIIVIKACCATLLMILIVIKACCATLLMILIVIVACGATLLMILIL